MREDRNFKASDVSGLLYGSLFYAHRGNLQLTFRIDFRRFPSDTIQYNTIQYNTIQYNTIQFYLNMVKIFSLQMVSMTDKLNKYKNTMNWFTRLPCGSQVNY